MAGSGAGAACVVLGAAAGAAAAAAGAGAFAGGAAAPAIAAAAAAKVPVVEGSSGAAVPPMAMSAGVSAVISTGVVRLAYMSLVNTGGGNSTRLMVCATPLAASMSPLTICVRCSAGHGVGGRGECVLCAVNWLLPAWVISWSGGFRCCRRVDWVLCCGR